MFGITDGLRSDQEAEQQVMQVMLSKLDPHQNRRFAWPLLLSNTGGPQDKSIDGRPTYHRSKSLEVAN